MSYNRELEKIIWNEDRVRSRGEKIGAALILVQQADADIAALQAMLKKHEWLDSGVYCPECQRQEHIGHAPDCEWARLQGEGE